MNLNSYRLWLIGSCLLALLLPPLMIRGDQVTRSARIRYGEEIARLSPSDRERLDRNFEEYLQLSEQDRSRLQDFQLQLTATGPDAAETAEAMQHYLNWVKTLPPYQREALMKEIRPAARLDLIREYLEKQRQKNVDQWLERELRELPPWIRRPLSEAPALSSAQLQTLMTSIEEKAGKQLSPSQREQLDSLTGVEHYVSLLQHLKNSAVSPWSSELFWRELNQDILSGPLADFKRTIEQRLGPGPGPFSEVPRAMVQLILLASLIRELQLEQQQFVSPTNEMLEKQLAELPPEEQDRLLSLEAFEFRQELIQRLEQQKTKIKVTDVIALLGPGTEIRQRFQGMGPGPRNRTPFPGGGRPDRSPPGFPAFAPPNGFGADPESFERFPERMNGNPDDVERFPEPNPRLTPDGKRRFPGAGNPQPGPVKPALKEPSF